MKMHDILEDPIAKERITRMEKAVRERFKGRTFLRVYEVAEFLEINPRRVYMLIENGSLPAIKVTGARGRTARVRILVEDLIAYLSERIIESEGSF